MNRIRELRVSKNFTQVKLAELLNCTSTAVSKYEQGQLGLDAELINKLCGIFGCTADYLLCRSDSPSAVISEDEASLLRAYRAADDHTRAVVRLALEPFSAGSRSTQVS